MQLSSLKDAIAKKDEEIERLQLLKSNVNGGKHGTNSHISESSSPRRHSTEGPRQSPRASEGKSLGPSDKVTSGMDNSSDNSEKRSEAGSPRDDYRHQNAPLPLPQSKSVGDLRHKKELLSQPQLRKYVSQNVNSENTAK